MKKILVLLLVLIGGAASAADFLSTFSEYRSQIRIKLNVSINNTTYLSDSTIDQFVREGIVQIAPLLHGDRGVYAIPSGTQFRKDSYVLDTFVQGVQSVVISKNDTVKALLYVPKSRWYQMEHRSTSGQKDPYLKRPSYYDYYDNTLYLFPAPTLTGDSIKVEVWRKIPNISTSPTLSNLHQSARLSVMKYAAWQAAQAKQHPLAPFLKAEYERSLIETMNSIDGNVGAQTNGSLQNNGGSTGTVSTGGSASSSQ